MKKKNVIKVLFLCCLIVHSTLSAQKRRTVVVDSSNSNTMDYRFSPFFYAPPTIGNSSVNLNLEIANNKLGSNQIRILKFANTNEPTKSIGTSDDITSKETSLAILLNVNKDLQDMKTPLTIKGNFTESAQGIVELNSSDKTSASYDINKTPRLVVDYELAKEPYGMAWSQMNGNAQHSNQMDWTFGNFTAPVSQLKNFEVVGASDKYWSLYTYKNKAILFSAYSSNPFAVAFSGAQRNQELWRLPLASLPNRKPVITPDGKMIYISEKKILEVLELNEGKRIASQALSDIKITIKQGQTHSINELTNDMTLGYDGTLYMPISNANGRFGIVALSAYPQLMPRWFYNTTNPVGPVSLSKDEKMVFFIETYGSAKSRLVVLDNVNGAVLTQSEGILSSFRNDGNSYIPPVVIQNGDKDTSVVYVLDGNKTSNKLFLFKVHYDQFSNGGGQQISPFRLMELAMGRYISQSAVLNKEEVLMFYDKKLRKYNYKTDGFTVKSGIDVDNLTPTILTSNETSYTVVLSSNTLYIIDPNTNLSTSFKIAGANIVNAWRGIVLNPNFSIYVQLQDGSVKQFIPLKIQANQSQANLNEIKNKCTYLHNGLIAAAPITVTNNTQAIVQGGKISFPRGFKVQKGAALTFQIIK